MYDNGDFDGVLESLGKLQGGIEAAAEDMAAEDYQDKKKALFEGMLNDVKGNIGKYLPSMLGSGILGAGASLLTGAVGGPLLGASLGIATDLAVHSEGVKNWLFGDRDEKGNRKGNVITKDLANNIEKY